MKIDCVSGLNLNKYSEKRVRKMHVLWIMLSETRALIFSMLGLEGCLHPLSKFLATRLVLLPCFNQARSHNLSFGEQNAF